MSTRSAKAKGFTINPRRIAAVIAQLGSYATTFLFFQALGFTNWTLIGVSAGFEFLLAVGKHIVFSGENRADALGWAAIVIDTVLNGGGMWPAISHTDKSGSWTMLAEGLALQKDMRNLPALAIALALGFLLSIAPHRLWNK